MGRTTTFRPSHRSRQQYLKSTSIHALTKSAGWKLVGFRERKSIKQLASAPHVKPTKLEDVHGDDADVWLSGEEFEKLIADAYALQCECQAMARA